MFANRGAHVGTGTQPSVRDLAVWKKIYENTITGDLRHRLDCCRLLTRNKPQFPSFHRPLGLLAAKGLAFFLLPLLTCGLREAASTLSVCVICEWEPREDAVNHIPCGVR